MTRAAARDLRRAEAAARKAAVAVLAAADPVDAAQEQSLAVSSSGVAHVSEGDV